MHREAGTPSPQTIPLDDAVEVSSEPSINAANRFGNQQQQQQSGQMRLPPHLLPSAPQDVSGLEAAYKRAQGNLWGQGNRQKAIFDQQAAAIDEQREIQKRRIDERKELEGRYYDDVQDARLSADYPGLSLFEIKDLKDIVGDTALTKLERATAQRKLEKAQEIDPHRSFGNVFSKILAAVSIGIGKHASYTTGRNVAQDMFNKTVADDVAVQKDMFNRKGRIADRKESSYEFFMKRFNDEEAAELNAAALTGQRAILGLQGQLAKMQMGEKAHQMGIKIEELKMSQKGLQDNAAKAAMAAMREFDIGTRTAFDGVRRTDPGLKQEGLQIEKTWIKLDAAAYEIDNAAKLISDHYAKNYTKFGWGSQAARSQVIGMYSNLVNGIRKAKEMGVLQEFEKKELDEAVGSPSRMEALIVKHIGITPQSTAFAQGFVAPIRLSMAMQMDRMSKGPNAVYQIKPGSDYDLAVVRANIDALGKEVAEETEARKKVKQKLSDAGVKRFY